MNFSIIVPIHNEASMLPKTINSVYKLQPSEVIFLMDRCTDKSEAIIRRHREANMSQTGTELRYYNEEDGVDWAFRPAYLRRDAYNHTHNKVILNTSADIRLDQNIAKYLQLIPHFKLLSFGYLDYPYNPQSWIKTVVSAATPLHGYAGLIAFDKDAWLDSEDINDLKKSPRGEDTHLQLAISAKHLTRHINTRSLHLRPNESKADHYNRGIVAYQQIHSGVAKAFLSSLVMLRPALFAGYMHQRRNKS